jgi:hypothetical protein
MFFQSNNSISILKVPMIIKSKPTHPCFSELKAIFLHTQSSVELVSSVEKDLDVQMLVPIHLRIIFLYQTVENRCINISLFLDISQGSNICHISQTLFTICLQTIQIICTEEHRFYVKCYVCHLEFLLWWMCIALVYLLNTPLLWQ